MAEKDILKKSSILVDYSISIFLVDDQPIVGEQVRRMLAGEKGIEFHYCQDPAIAVKMATKIHPTVILLDLVMPQIDGLTLVKFLRASSTLRDVPIIVLSTKEEPAIKAEAFSLGANDYLVKLPDRVELLARIKYHSKAYINFLERNDAYSALLQSQKSLRSELSQAADYVKSLLPAEIPDGNIRTEWRFIPSEQLGGDSFGYHWLDDDNLSLYLLDVCGHGVGSALMSISAINVLRAKSLPDTDFHDPASVLHALNSNFQMDDHNDMYFTMWYGVYNKNTNVLKYASAGHPPAILISKDSPDIKTLSTRNFIIGGISDFEYSSDEIEITKPSKLFIYSDGVYEIFKTDGEMWEIDKFYEYMKFVAAGEGSEIDKLHKHVIDISGNEVLEDDFSMMKIEFL